MRDAALIQAKQRLNGERSDEELGSLSYWRILAEALGKMQGEIDFTQRSEEARHIFDELNDKGRVKRSTVEDFYNGWNEFLVLKADTEAERQADVAAGKYQESA